MAWDILGALGGDLRHRQEAHSGVTIAVDRLRIGKVFLDDLPELEWLARERWVDLEPRYLPGLSLSRSLASTGGGTSLDTSPPSRQTSLQRFDET